jgi:glutamate synthase domain-containing protein 3
VIIDSKGVYYKDLNDKIYRAVENGAKKIVLKNVNGQRYIGSNLRNKVKINIDGVPGNDLAAFMDGPEIFISDNAQDVVANTMNSGKIVVNGDAGDVLGYGMRGGRLFVKGDVGYRVGIHMKSYKKQIPVIIAGGTAQDFLGEYMAGGIIIILGLDRPGKHGSNLRNNGNNRIVGDYTGTGMHGGKMYIRGEVERYQIGAEVDLQKSDEADLQELEECLREYCGDFGLDLKKIMEKDFVKLVPHSSRPYGDLYCY